MGEKPAILLGRQDALALPQRVAPNSKVKSAQQIEPRGREAAFRAIVKAGLKNMDTDRAEPGYGSRSHERALAEVRGRRIGSLGAL